MYMFYNKKNLFMVKQFIDDLNQIQIKIIIGGIKNPQLLAYQIQTKALNNVVSICTIIIDIGCLSVNEYSLSKDFLIASNEFLGAPKCFIKTCFS